VLMILILEPVGPNSVDTKCTICEHLEMCLHFLLFAKEQGRTGRGVSPSLLLQHEEGKGEKSQKGS